MLGRFPEIASSDVEKLEASLKSNAGGKRFHFEKGEHDFFFRVNAARFDEVSLLWLATRSKVSVSFGPADYARRVFQLRNPAQVHIGRQSRDCVPGTEGYVVPPECDDWHVNYDHGGFECLSLRVDSEAMARKMRALTGIDSISRVALEQPHVSSTARHHLLHQSVHHFAIEVDHFGNNLPALIRTELEQGLILRFLMYSDHEYVALLNSTPLLASSHQLSKLEDYIYSNWNKPLDIESLTDIADVSGRTIYRMFREHHGCSPHKFIENVRLRRARELLLMDTDSNTVTGVAYLCGFSNLGHFSRAYRSLFGELPSNTIRRPK